MQWYLFPPNAMSNNNQLVPSFLCDLEMEQVSDYVHIYFLAKYLLFSLSSVHNIWPRIGVSFL